LTRAAERPPSFFPLFAEKGPGIPRSRDPDAAQGP
jgi:hypothetical protein